MYGGTLIFFYSVMEGGMSHVHNLFLLTVLIYTGIMWLRNGGWKNTIAIGISIGLLTLIRPTNIIFAGLLPLMEVSSLKAFKTRFQYFLKQYKQVIVMMVLAFLVFFIQMLYWKTQTGDWLYYSYKDEGFHFDNPHILDGLLSYRKGLLVYTPILIFGFIGWILIGLGVIKHERWRLTFGIMVPLFFYIVFSWWCWWYGGGFGNRATIEIFPLLIIAGAFFFQFIKDKNKWILLGITPVFGFLIYLNVIQSKQMVKGLLHHDGMTKAAYWENFMVLDNTTPQYYDMLRMPDYENAKLGEPEFHNWLKMLPNGVSNVIDLDPSTVGDSIVVKGTIYSNLKTATQTLHLIVTELPITKDERYTGTLIPTPHPYTNEFELTIAVPRTAKGSKIRVYLHYTGVSEAYYRPISVVEEED